MPLVILKRPSGLIITIGWRNRPCEALVCGPVSAGEDSDVFPSTPCSRTVFTTSEQEHGDRGEEQEGAHREPVAAEPELDAAGLSSRTKGSVWAEIAPKRAE